MFKTRNECRNHWDELFENRSISNRSFTWNNKVTWCTVFILYLFIIDWSYHNHWCFLVEITLNRFLNVVSFNMLPRHGCTFLIFNKGLDAFIHSHFLSKRSEIHNLIVYFKKISFWGFCVVICFFHPRHNGRWPPTLKDFLSQILSITFIFLS